MIALLPSVLFTRGRNFETDILEAIGSRIAKQAEDAADPVVSYDLAGRLYLSPNGWIMLSIPNALVRGVYANLAVPGIELPPSPEGAMNAHVSVMRPEELASIGGAEKITERGKTFRYTLGRLYTTEPAGWKEMEKVWFLRVHSPELQTLRRSYGLSSLPNDGKFDFHISIAVRRKGVLARNDKSKTDQPSG